MKKRYILPVAAIAVCAALFLWFLNADICIGRMENRTDDQWSHMHMYLNREISVPFPVTGENTPCVFQYETGRGSFSVTITDATGAVLYRDTTDTTGSAIVYASSDLTLNIRGQGHGGLFALTRLDHLEPDADPQNPSRLLGEGTHSGDTFTADFHCRRVEGKRVNFYVENRGSEPVILTINGSYARTIPAGEAGHISAPIPAAVVGYTMTLECVSADGAELDIYWKAAQRN